MFLNFACVIDSKSLEAVKNVDEGIITGLDSTPQREVQVHVIKKA